MYSDKREIFAAHVPVISRAYLEVFEEQLEQNKELFVMRRSITGAYRQTQKDIRALHPDQATTCLEILLKHPVHQLGNIALHEIARDGHELTLPDEALSRQLVIDYDIGNFQITPIFLRWDRQNTTTQVEVETTKTIALEDLPEEVVQLLAHEQSQSKDWWRQVAAVFTVDDSVLVSEHNQYVPSEYSAEIDSDMRAAANRGSSIELANAHHAEALAIAVAAREGKSLDQSDCYTTTYPCPLCAKQISAAGVKRVYYLDGYAVADGAAILEAANIETIKIVGSLPSVSQSTKPVLYPKHLN